MNEQETNPPIMEPETGAPEKTDLQPGNGRKPGTSLPDKLAALRAAKKPGRPRKVIPLADVDGDAVSSPGGPGVELDGLPSGESLSLAGLEAVLKTADRLNAQLMRRFGRTAFAGEDAGFFNKLADEAKLTDEQARTIAEPMLAVAKKYGWNVAFGPEIALGFAALPWIMPNFILWTEIAKRLRGPKPPEPQKEPENANN